MYFRPKFYAMSLNRQQALHEVLDRVPNHQPRPANKISEYFGENVFNLHVMRSYLPDEAYEGIVEAMEKMEDKGGTVDMKNVGKPFTFKSDEATFFNLGQEIQE